MKHILIMSVMLAVTGCTWLEPTPCPSGYNCEEHYVPPKYPYMGVTRSDQDIYMVAPFVGVTEKGEVSN